MTGLFLILLTAIWVVVALAVSIWIARRLKGSIAQWLVGLLLCTSLLVLPVIDEVIADPQFDALCREGAVLKIDEQRIRGRRIKLAFEPINAPVANIAVPAMYTRVIFRDAATREELGSYGRYVAKGGWLIRSLGISESDSPIWMSRAYCSPEIGEEQMAIDYQFEITH